jgi:hypothetical protein
VAHKFPDFCDVKPLNNNSAERGSMLLLLRLLQGRQREHNAAAVEDVAPQFRKDCEPMVRRGTSIRTAAK